LNPAEKYHFEMDVRGMPGVEARVTFIQLDKYGRCLDEMTIPVSLTLRSLWDTWKVDLGPDTEWTFHPDTKQIQVQLSIAGNLMDTAWFDNLYLGKR